MSIIDSLKTYIMTCPLFENEMLRVDFLAAGVSFSITPLPGNRITNTYINGTQVIEYPFALQTQKYTTDELTRLESLAFHEDFGAWLTQKNNAKEWLTLTDPKQKPTFIGAVNWGTLFELGVSDVGIYQITCRFIFEQAK